MSEAEAPQAQEEPDTPEDQVGVPEIVEIAAELASYRRDRKRLEDLEEKLTKDLLEKWEQLPNLHGIRLQNGDAVRRTWSVRTTAKPEPSRLRELMADAGHYIREAVDLPALRKDYPSIWEQAGKVKRTKTITVRLKGEKDDGR